MYSTSPLVIHASVTQKPLPPSRPSDTVTPRGHRGRSKGWGWCDAVCVSVGGCVGGFVCMFVLRGDRRGHHKPVKGIRPPDWWTGPLIILKGATRAQCCCASAWAKANTGRGWLSLPSQTSKTGDQFSLWSSTIPGSDTHTHGSFIGFLCTVP